MTTLELKDGNVWAVRGDLDMQSVPEVLGQAGKIMEADSEQVLDLGEVSRIDTAGLACLIELLRDARENDLSLRFQNIPARMRAVARVCGLEGILPKDAFQRLPAYASGSPTSGDLP
jgi:phospholipid transport system transporter-binding protein